MQISEGLLANFKWTVFRAQKELCAEILAAIRFAKILFRFGLFRTAKLSVIADNRLA